MPRDHLTSEELQAAYDGRLEGLDAIEHLVTCPQCQATYDDTRWSLLLRALKLEQRVRRESALHPEPDVLKAYVLSALSGDRTREVRDHLAECYRCTALVYRELEARRDSGYDSPTAELLGRVRSSVRQRQGRVGRLRVRRLGDRFDLVFTPGSDQTVTLLQTFRTRLGPAQHRWHPHSLRRRVEKGQPSGEPEPSSPESKPPPSGGPSGQTIEADPLHLVVEPVLEPPGLSLRVLDSRFGSPIPGLSVQLEPAPGGRLERFTDADGRVELPFQPGSAVLRIGGPSPVTFELEYAD